MVANNFIEYINSGLYSEAKKCISHLSQHDFSMFIMDLGLDTNNTALYSFVVWMIIEKETASMHSVAGFLIGQIFFYVEGASSMGLAHVRRAVDLAPYDVSYKETLLYYYQIPDKILPKQEAIQIAKALELQDPGNNAVQRFFTDIKAGY